MSTQQKIRHEQLLSPEDNDTAATVKEAVSSKVVARSGATTREETADEQESLEDRAIRFLLHSSLSDLNLGQKLSFLETKGFTPPQIHSILEEVHNIQRRHLEDTFEKTFDHVAMPSKISNTYSHPSSSYNNTNAFNNQRNEYYQPHQHQQQLYQQPPVSEVTTGDTGSKATVIGMFGGLVAMVGMAGWRWINGGDFELFPPPRIIQDSSDPLNNNSNADLVADQSHNHEDEEDGEYSANDASMDNTETQLQELNTKNFTNNAMDFLKRNQLDADTKMDESNNEELPLQEQLVSLDVKLTHLLDSITSVEPLQEHAKETTHDKRIETIKQMKLLLSSILLESNDSKDVTTNKSANSGEDSTPDLQETEAIFIEGDEPKETPNSSEDNRTSIASTNDEPKNDTELTQEVDEQGKLCQSTTAAIHTENNEVEPTITLSCCKDDTIFADCLLKLCCQCDKQENIHNIDVSTTISTIYMYCNNIVKHNHINNSNNKKYCKVNTNNAMFQKYIQQVPGAIEVLESLGFAMVKDDVTTSNTMEWNQPLRWINAAADDTHGADTDENWNGGITCLKKVCEELQAVKEQLSRMLEG